MAHISPSVPSIRDRLLKEIADRDSHADGVERRAVKRFWCVIPEPISSDPWQSMENQPFPTLSVISDRSELSGIGMTT
jgi:hypothetical protein